MNKLAIKEHLLVFFRVFLGGFIFVGLFNLEAFSNLKGIGMYRVLLNGFTFGMIWTLNGILSNLFEDRFTWTKTPLKRLAIVILGTVIATAVTFWITITLWDAPIDGIDPLRLFRGGASNSFVFTLFITISISLFMYGRSFLNEWRQSAAEAERLKKEQISARYETLKNQVNPHFLFNSLAVLTELVHKDADQAEQFIRQLSAVYRYVLDSRDREMVTLAEELRQLEAYLYLLKIRFGESFVAHIDLPHLNHKVAPLTLQMLVENAVKHNEASKANPLHLILQEEGDYITVSNNIQPKKNIPHSSGVGLENIKARYRFLTNKTVEIVHTADTFLVKIPVIE